MAKKVAELRTELKSKHERVKQIFDAADARTGDLCGVNTTEELAEVKRLHIEIKPLEEQLAEAMEVEGIKSSNSDWLNKYNTPANGNFTHQGGDGGRQEDKNALKTVGQQFLDDENVQAYFKSLIRDGHVPTRVNIQTPAVQVKTLITGVSATSAGPLVNQDRKPIVDSSFMRPLTVKDIITMGETGSDTVEYVRVGTPTNNAAPVAEATATADGSGAKPESALPMSLITETVKTIAHWIPATNRAMADAGQLKTLIDSFLRYGIDEELEDQILTGNGAGENFDGILHVIGTTPQAFATNVLTTTRKGRTKVKTTGRARPTAWVFHPNDWEAIDLLQDNEARYYYGGPMQMGNPTLWGLPVVESEGMTEGFCVVADWKLAVLWDRLQTAISMTNSHSDFFVRNLVAILAEMRAAFGVIRPKAFVICDLTA